MKEGGDKEEIMGEGGGRKEERESVFECRKLQPLAVAANLLYLLTSLLLRTALLPQLRHPQPK